MRWFLTALVAVALGAPASAFPQTPADSAAIRATALDYIEGWYTGDPVRMERALHPELVDTDYKSLPRRTAELWLAERGEAKPAAGGGRLASLRAMLASLQAGIRYFGEETYSGLPGKASPELGEQILDTLGSAGAELVTQLLDGELPEREWHSPLWKLRHIFTNPVAVRLADAWLGVPVTWPEISGAAVIVESSLPSFIADPSQGSHFFHNLTSHRILYFTVRHGDPKPIDWAWLGSQPAVLETKYLRHLRLSDPLRIKVDGRSGRGVILRRFWSSCAAAT